jgi:hemerythrin-like domain-containing protein
MTRALQTIRIEHFNYASVLRCLRRLLDGAPAQAGADYRDLLFLVLDYVEAFPATFHHPKEDTYLFAALRRRRPGAAPLLDRLEDEHARALDLLAELRTALEAWRGEPAEFKRLREAGRRYLAFEEDHMLREEREVLPLALEALTGADWRAIDDAFAENDDPLFGGARSQQFDLLFRLILTGTAETMGAAEAPPPAPRISA